MAENEPKRKPRLRKTAPTIRERVEAASREDSSKQASRSKKTIKRTMRLSGKLKPPRNKVTNPLFTFVAGVWRFTSWLTPSYFKQSWIEVRQVTWPNRRETWRLTLAVFVFSIVFGAMVGAVDWGLDEIFKRFVLR